MAQLILPTPLRPFADDQSTIQVSGDTVSEMLSDLDNNYPDLMIRLCDNTGELKSYITLFVNGENVDYLQNDNTAVQQDTQVRIVSALAGG